MAAVVLGFRRPCSTISWYSKRSVLAEFVLANTAMESSSNRRVLSSIVVSVALATFFGGAVLAVGRDKAVFSPAWYLHRHPLEAEGLTKYNIPAVLDLLCGRLDRLRDRLAADPALIHRRFRELDFGTTGGRMLTLKGATVLHVPAEYQNLDAVRLRVDLGADVNARATVDS